MVSLCDHVHRALRMAIISGRYPHKTRLSERQLAVELGLSTTPLDCTISKERKWSCRTPYSEYALRLEVFQAFR